MGGGLIFVAHALRDQMQALPPVNVTANLTEYAALVALATLTTVITASLHTEILANDVDEFEIDRNLTRYAYAISQVARYIPGKIFGVILESQILGPSAGLFRVIKATLLQTVLVYGWAGFLSISILATIKLDAVWLLMLCPLAIPFLWSRQGRRLVHYIGRRANPAGFTHSAETGLHRKGRQHSLRCMILLALQWVPFFAMWSIIVGLDEGASETLWLGASYLLASIAGSISVFAPSGLIVREAVFIWLGGLHGAPAASLLISAITMRIALTLADVMAIPLLWGALRVGNKK